MTIRARLGDLLRVTRSQLGLARPRGEGWHRRGVGGRWDELGELQLRFLVERGLLPQHRLLDVGCGSLRGGVRFVAYLDPGHYFGIEKEEALLDAGREVELVQAGLADRGAQLYVTDAFALDWVPASVAFEFALAQSLLTHLRPGLVRLCIRNVVQRLAPGGVFYASFFESLDGRDVLGPAHGWRADELQHPRYRRETLQALAEESGATFEYLGPWGHPRDSRMVALRAAGSSHLI